MFVPRFPLHVVLILGSRCNLTCIHCSSNAHKNADWGFDTNAASTILDELADCGVVDVALSGGEPLLRKDLAALITHARARLLSVGTSTSGFPLTARRAHELASAGLSRLQVSIDGLADMHDAVRGKGAFSKAVAAVGHSLDAGLRTHVCFTAMNINAHQLEDVIALAARLGVHGFNLSQFVPTGRGDRKLDIGPTTARTLLETWLRARKAHPDMSFSAHAAGLADLEPEHEYCSGGCQAGLSIGCITADGDVTPCVMFPYKLGNLKDGPFADAWTGAWIRGALARRDIKGACAACSHRITCGGCRAAAWAYTGDPLGEDPRCWVSQSAQPVA